MNYGLIESTVRDIRDYVVGQAKVPYIPYQPDGDWTKYLPRYESQSDMYETYGCAVWGTQNQIEILYKRLYGEEPNYSERFNYERVGIRPYGTDPQNVYENIRKDGLVDASDYPMPFSYELFASSAGITGSLLAKGLNWLYNHTFMHEWLWTEYPTNALDVLKDALTTSPIAISVSAWFPQGNVYVDNGQRNNHWCVAYKVDDTGIYVFDSYDNSRKLLSLDHKIRMAKRIWINKKTEKGLNQQVNLLQAIIKRLFMQKTLRDVLEEALGTDASPNDLAPDENGCAETVTTLLRKVYPQVPIITGTYSLYDYLRNPKNGFVQVTDPSPETIIICPTTLGHPISGHTGFFMADMTIASNDSRTGKFMKNYDLATWTERYVNKGGYKISYFKKA